MVIKHGAEKKPEFVGCFAEKKHEFSSWIFWIPQPDM
jgi:hypothetical protein